MKYSDRLEKKEVGDHVILKGRAPKGIIRDLKDKWASVEWQTEEKGPKIVHLDELAFAPMYPDDGGLQHPVRKFEDTFSAITVLQEMFFTKKE